MDHTRPTNLANIVVACAVVAVLTAFAAYVLLTRPIGVTPEAGLAAVTATSIDPVRRSGFVMFRHTAPNDAYGRVHVSALDAEAETRHATPLTCDRVYFAGDRGVCLMSDQGVFTTYQAVTFDDTFTPLATLPLPGIPSRVRVSPDGRRAGLTVFVSGDSYAAGNFSTRTYVVDTGNGRVLVELEQLTLTRDGAPFAAQDFNYWGVTFADANRFFATLATGGKIYLVEGTVDSKQARVVREGVECPSLSPEQGRVVFKKRTREGIRLVWRLAVLDLHTGHETLLAETRSVDDQSDWLDAGHVVYAVSSDTTPGSTDIWVVPSDGTGSPRLFLPNAWSPAILRAEPR